MGISRNHSLPLAERKCGGGRITKNRFNRVDNVLADIYADFANGLTKTEIMSKLTSGLYKDQERAVKERMAYDYIKVVEDRIKQDFETSRGELASKIALNYINIYSDAMENGDRMSAVKALDGLSKLMIPSSPTTAIQVNGGESSSVVVQFGFPEKKDDE